MPHVTEEAIVLVGGLGTRLRSVVSNLPKPLAPVCGRPFLAHLLDQLASGGLRRVILATGYRAEQVEQVIGSRWAGMDIVYAQEDQPLGTGGAIRNAVQYLLSQSVHVANGDTFLRYRPRALEEITYEAAALLGMALAQVPDVGRYGAVEVSDHRVRAFREKGGVGVGLINAGSYFLPADALAALPSATSYSFEEAVLLPASAQGKVAALTDTSDFIDIGVPEDYALAQRLLESPA
ncbi:MAG: sugar phosphate nucleotidyltransferase [Rhodanobacter sp.]